MPTLDWIGKKAVLNHHREVPFRLLKTEPSLSVGDPNCGNLLVQGDNLHALKALLPYYAGQVKCIYIDPPYNTGNENWTYNDAVNSPEMRDWLGKVVGREAEDLSRHDKWLCMMYPRLCLLRQFLRDDGLIFVQIGHEESAHLRLLLDEVFGTFRNAIVVRRGIKNVQAQFATVDSLASAHDLIYCYSRRQGLRIPRLQHELGDNVAGKWDTFWRGTDRPTMRYDLFGDRPETGQWRWKEERARRAVRAYEDYLATFSHDHTLDEYYVKILTEQGVDLDFVRQDESGTVQYYVPPRSYKIIGDVWMDVSTSGTVTDFPHEKHLELLARILQWVTGPEDIILDSFAGSGSTAHAVLELNKADAGNRRFLLVEMDEQICRTVTATRITKLVSGGTTDLPGLDGGFRYATLGEPLFDASGNIRSDVGFADLAAHIFFVATGVPLPKRKNGKTPLLGAHNGVGVYLLYNGILGDQTSNGGNVLTRAVLEQLPPHDGTKVIYGTGCRIGADRLKRDNIVFRQIPYHVRVE
ncbi:MAG: site-specific DNA-methyltransferase [Candidatus Hydrogenedentes bacterium]|nr:site-specific DNA-methyltransferase [Candidatus Hydrogenedentota bacterium]